MGRGECVWEWCGEGGEGGVRVWGECGGEWGEGLEGCGEGVVLVW